MAAQLDAKFFRKAKKVNRAVEITDNEAFIPAVKDTPELRVKLPSRRLQTMDERKSILDTRMQGLVTVEEEIEVERKTLLTLVKDFELTNSGAAAVVAQNLKIKGLMERRAQLSRPEQWIEELPGLSLKDVFESKRDERKIGSTVYQLKRRVEPIIGLYVDLVKEAVKTEVPVEAPPLKTVGKPETVLPAKTTADVAKGAIIGKRIIKLKKPPV